MPTMISAKLFYEKELDARGLKRLERVRFK
jgi:hypothetical protein